jgi:hypothetical protein
MQSLLRRFDLRSALIGLGVAGSLLLLTALAVPTPPVKTLRITLDPEPTSIVRISEGQTFQVPSKLRLVLKAVGVAGGGGAGGSLLNIKINGEVVLGSTTGATGLLSLEFPLVAQPGDVVSVEEPFGGLPEAVFATGYLAE